MLPYVLATLLILGFGEDSTHGAAHRSTVSICFRVLLGAGALPTLIASVLTYRAAEGDDFLAARRAAVAISPRHQPCGQARLLAQEGLLGRLAGCSLSWMLYDFMCARARAMCHVSCGCARACSTTSCAHVHVHVHVSCGCARGCSTTSCAHGHVDVHVSCACACGRSTT